MTEFDEAYAEEVSESSLKTYFNNNPDHGVVIDFGGRIGEHTRKLKNCTVVEIDEASLNHMRRNKIPCQNIESFILDTKDGSVDLVFCSHVFEHIPNPGTMMKIIREKMAHTGKLHIIVPSETPLFEYCYNPIEGGHCHSYTLQNLATALHMAGFRPLFIRYRFGKKLQFLDGHLIFSSIAVIFMNNIRPWLKLMDIDVSLSIECMAIRDDRK